MSSLMLNSTIIFDYVIMTLSAHWRNYASIAILEILVSRTENFTINKSVNFQNPVTKFFIVAAN